MKKLILLILMINSSLLISQNDVKLSYNSIGSGRSVNLTFSKTFHTKNEIGIGVVFNINKLAHDDDQSNIFYKRLYATNFSQHFGIETFYNRRILGNLENGFEAFFFYDLQLKKSTTRNRSFSPYAYEQSTGDVLYKEHLDYWGPFTWIEQNIGVGYKAKIFKNIYVSSQIGVGVMLIIPKDLIVKDIYNSNSTLEIGEKVPYEFEMLIQTGLIYRIDR